MLLILGATAAAALTGCRFDGSGIPPDASPFAGCFAATLPEPVTLNLAKADTSLLTGTLRRGEGDGARVYALEGEAESFQLAVLTAFLSGSPGEENRVIVLRSVAGALTVRINDGPPLGPLEPCP